MAVETAATRADLLIAGRHQPARSGRYFQTVDPANERVIANVAEADAAGIFRS